MIPILRVARPTNDIQQVLKFYVQGLDLEILSEFHDHDGFDGIMLGRRGSPYHFEFTQKKGHTAPRAPTQDHLIVFYIPEAPKIQQAVSRMRAEGFEPVRSFNPYWDVRGKTFEDFEGYRVVLQNSDWGI